MSRPVLPATPVARPPAPPAQVVPPRAPIRRTLAKLRPLIWVVTAIAALAVIVSVFVAVDTKVLWFRSIGYSSVYDRRLTTQIVLFLIFGLTTGIATTAVLWLAARVTRPVGAVVELTRLRKRWHELPARFRRLVLIGVPVVLTLRAGFAGASQWQTWLLWRNSTSFGRSDPAFHRDYGYYVFVYPWHRYVVTYLVSTLLTLIVIAVVLGWLRGGLKVRGPAPRTTTGIRALLSALLGLLFVAKAGAYWLDRLGTVTSSRGVVTGPSYTDLHIVIQTKFTLMIVALVAAVACFANVAVRRWRLPVAAVATLVVCAVVGGGIVPTVVQALRVKPSTLSAEKSSITNNIAATRYGFGLDGNAINVVPGYAPTSAASGRAMAQLAMSTTQAKLLDPNKLSPTFTQLQQQRPFYSFKSTLDVDRYNVGGTTRDEVIGLRELNLSGLPASQRTWTNQHVVYTHGLGVVSAPADGVDAAGKPAFDEQGIPSSGALGSGFQDRIYFGQSSPSYSVVGAAHGQGEEFDSPDQPNNYSFQGKAGVPIGSVFHRLIYALKFRDKNLLFSSAINSNSQLLYLRNPRTRVNQVAPWLTLDGDAYPVVTGGHIVWVVDGYTTTSQLPDSQETGLGPATSTTYVTQGSTVAQHGQVNYIRNSVVATVDAYDGAVRLYQKTPNVDDPILATWMKAFPNLVKPYSDIPADLLPHLRYPQDMFNLQRTVLAKYHVTDARTFYAGSDFWKVPIDPSVKANVNQPSYYATIAPNGFAPSTFALSTSLLASNAAHVTAYLSVDSDPGSGYGQMTLLQLTPTGGVESPGNTQNDIESDPSIASLLSLERAGQSSVVLGNQQMVPLAGGILAIEPIYEQAAGGQSYPILRHVVAVWNNKHIGFAGTLSGAINQAFGVTGSSGTKASDLLPQLQAAFAQLEQDQPGTPAYVRDQRQIADLLGRLEAATSAGTG